MPLVSDKSHSILQNCILSWPHLSQRSVPCSRQTTHDSLGYSYAPDRGRDRIEIWHRGSLGDEDDARMSNTCIAQRKRAIPHSTMHMC